MNQTDQKIPLLGHFQELRRRLGWVVLAVFIGVIIAFFFRDWLFFILEYPASGIPFIAITITENMSTIMLVSFVGGVILAMPFIIYHGIMFVAPALTPHEKKWVYIIVPWVFLMFLIGVAFGYFLLARWTIWFLYSFGADVASMMPRISDYINFLTKLLITTGLVFEMPVIATFLARLRILKPEWLAGKRAWAIILAFVAAAIITPPDPITQCLLAVPLVLLYEMSIILARLVYPKDKPEETESTPLK